MSFLLKNYSLVKVIYLLVICYKARFFLWNTNNTDKNVVNEHTHTHTHTQHTHTHTHTPEFNLPFSIAFVKSYPFATVGWIRMKICSPTNCLIPWVNKFPTVLKTILLSETIVSQAELAFIIWIQQQQQKKVQNKSKVNNRSTRHCSVVFVVNFEYIWQVSGLFFG